MGFELTGNVTFKDFLDHLKADTAVDIAKAQEKVSQEPETLNPEDEFTHEELTAFLTLDDLLKKAKEYGFKQSDIVTAAKIYHHQPNIHRLTTAQIEDLDKRMALKVQKKQNEPVKKTVNAKEIMA